MRNAIATRHFFFFFQSEIVSNFQLRVPNACASVCATETMRTVRNAIATRHFFF